MEPEIGQQILHYRVIRKLGQGGMGAVYLAEDAKLNRKVALKFLPAEMTADPDRLKRFEREAKTVASLNHPNIVTIYSVEEFDGVPFIVMELVEGRVLSELIPKDGQAIDLFFDLAIPIADAVSTAHDKGITHRDLKPGNIMVGSDGRVKVLDFGLAKLLEDSEARDATSLATQTLTKTGSALGTVTYMAPEQLKGKAPDQRADIFSLGIVFYQMASGQRPFTGETSAEIISSILRDAPAPVTDLKLEIPSHLGRIVKRCLEKNPNRRYQDASELHAELIELKREIDSGAVFEDEAKTRAITVQRRSRRSLAYAAAIAAGVGALLAGYLWTRSGTGGDVDESAGGSTHEVPTLAVLPFSTVGETADKTFADGLNQEVTSLMTALEELQVVSRSTARQRFSPETSTREIGRALGADYLLLGTVRWSTADDPVKTARATLQMIRVEDDIQVWSDSYDRQLADDLAIQAEIARHVVRAIGSSIFGMSDENLPAAPQPVELAAEKPVAPPARADPEPSVQTKAPSSAASGVIKIEETPSDPDPAASSREPELATLNLEFTTHAERGVLTIYADDRQILIQEFEFEAQKKGILGRKKPAGSLSGQQKIPANIESIRVYVLVDEESKLVKLTPSLAPSAVYQLDILLNRKGELEVSLH